MTTARGRVMAGLFIAIPAYSGVQANSLNALMALLTECSRRGVRTLVYPLGYADIVKARAELVSAFYRSDFEHCLMVDGDIAYPPELVFRMVERGVGCIGAAAPKRTFNWARYEESVRADDPAPHIRALDYEAAFFPSAGQQLEVVGGAAVCRYVGGGFLLLRHELVARLFAAHPELQFRDTLEQLCCALFNPIVCEGRFVDEDYAFSDRVRGVGDDVHVMMDAEIEHNGPYRFAGNLAHRLRAAGPYAGAGE